MAERTLTLQVDDQGRAASQFNSSLDFSTRIYETKLGQWPGNALDALRTDFTVADCALLPRTYFISSTASPRCVFEALALAIVKKHIPIEALGSAGAEWWVQKRPNGRAEILTQSGHSNEEQRMHTGGISQLEKKLRRQTSVGEKSQPGKSRRTQISIGEKSQRIDWHVDKDEELQVGTGIVLAPQLSTVTYLSDTGGATVLLDCAAHPATGSLCDLSLKPLSEPASIWTCQIVRPAIGRHLCFDGRRMWARSVT